jgi:hypothetical protein
MQQDIKTKLKCIALLWTWWKTRNKLNAEGKCKQQSNVEAQVIRLATEYVNFFVKQQML